MLVIYVDDQRRDGRRPTVGLTTPRLSNQRSLGASTPIAAWNVRLPYLDLCASRGVKYIEILNQLFCLNDDDYLVMLSVLLRVIHMSQSRMLNHVTLEA